MIDDEEDVRFIAQVSLGRVGGMTVIEARNGAEGVSRARSEMPDVILLDMMMPGMDGVATLRELRGDPQTTRIPIVFLTAKSGATDAERLLEMGASGIILKPFNAMTLASELTALLGV